MWCRWSSLGDRPGPGRASPSPKPKCPDGTGRTSAPKIFCGQHRTSSAAGPTRSPQGGQHATGGAQFNRVKDGSTRTKFFIVVILIFDLVYKYFSFHFFLIKKTEEKMASLPKFFKYFPLLFINLSSCSKQVGPSQLCSSTQYIRVLKIKVTLNNNLKS